ncbi:hypothetical protein J3A83DRAFT_4191128 [Scleroderma citrinum]
MGTSSLVLVLIGASEDFEGEMLAFRANQGAGFCPICTGPTLEVDWMYRRSAMIGATLAYKLLIGLSCSDSGRALVKMVQYRYSASSHRAETEELDNPPDMHKEVDSSMIPNIHVPKCHHLGQWQILVNWESSGEPPFVIFGLRTSDIDPE